MYNFFFLEIFDYTINPIYPELAVVLLALVMALRCPLLWDKWFQTLEHGFENAAQRRFVSVLGVFFLALGARAAILPILPAPPPIMTDEAAYLFAADTFLSGRLTNPAHLLWPHFECIHMISQPTFQSHFPIAQSLALAAGKLIGGNPWIGVWVSCALMAAVVCWMLQGWVGPRLALLGSLLVVVRFSTVSYWGSSFWGGAVAAMAGAMVLGALPRIMDKCEAHNSAIMGLGLVILANSRPLEGMVMSLPVAVALFVWMIRQKDFVFRRVALRIITPVFLILAIGGAATCYYNLQVTGDPFKMPYQVQIENYWMGKPLIWQKPDLDKKFRHADLEAYFRQQLDDISAVKAGYCAEIGRRAAIVWRSCLWPGLGWALFFVLFALHQKKTRLMLLLFLGALPAFFITSLWHLHHFAPMLGLFLGIALVGIQKIWRWQWKGRNMGRAFVRACAIMWILVLAAQLNMARVDSNCQMGWFSAFITARAKVSNMLQASGQRHLVIVRYESGHDLTEEWVLNKPDIDNSQIVWAREMDPEANKKLVEYFSGRRIWLLSTGSRSTNLSLYNPHKAFPEQNTP